MTVRRAEPVDLAKIESLLSTHSGKTRIGEIIRAALENQGTEYVAAVSDSGERLDAVAAYGLVAGTIGTAALYGVIPITSRATELLSFAAHDLKNLGAKQIVAEFPDTDEFKPYRDVLLESGYDPTGLVEDFYRDGVAMVIFTRALKA